MEITCMLTISTAHISFETNCLLQEDAAGVVCYPKETEGCLYGYFVLALGYDDTDESIPEDLRLCMEFALANNCDWLCLDCDGEILETLPTYDW